eukprot:gene16583-43609_t
MALWWLADGARPGDSLWLSFAGRAARQLGEDGWCPSDWRTNGVITGGDLWEALL